MPLTNDHRIGLMYVRYDIVFDDYYLRLYINIHVTVFSKLQINTLKYFDLS